MKSRLVHFVSSLVVLATLLQFVCCLKMANAGVADAPAGATSEHSCCGSDMPAPGKSSGESTGDPCKSCPVMSGANVGLNHVTTPVSMVPDLASPISTDLIEVFTKSALTNWREAAYCITATSPAPDLLVQHCIFQL